MNRTTGRSLAAIDCVLSTEYEIASLLPPASCLRAFVV